jgi:hypothetical protein
MAAGGTYEPIATTTLTTSQAIITFSSISASYTDLVLVTVAKLTSGTAGMKLQFNSDTANNYSNIFLYGDGSSPGSVQNSNTNGINFYYAAVLGSTDFSITTSNIMNYSNSTTFKTVIARDGQSGSGTDAIASVWQKAPEVINRIDVIVTNANVYAAGSTFSLYGIKAA